jgi:uncharacterized damage-inducible protein DinB
MFFDSILKTLNHIISVDEAIHSFIHTKNLPKLDLNFVPYPSYGELSLFYRNFSIA